MRTLTQRTETRREIMEGCNNTDVTVVEALMELALTIEEASTRIAEAHDETRLAIERISDEVGRHLKATAA
jgi:hypothetical protein